MKKTREKYWLIFRSPKDSRWYVRLVAGNGRIICDAGNFNSKASAYKNTLLINATYEVRNTDGSLYGGLKMKKAPVSEAQ